MSSIYVNAEQTKWLEAEALKADEKPAETLRAILERVMNEGVPTGPEPVDLGKTAPQRLAYGQTLSGKSILGR